MTFRCMCESVRFVQPIMISSKAPERTQSRKDLELIQCATCARRYAWNFKTKTWVYASPMQMSDIDDYTRP